MNKPKNHGKEWTKSDVKKLEKLADAGVPTKEIAVELGRTIDSIYNEASKEDISLKPADK